MKNITTAVLLAFVALSVIYVIVQQSRNNVPDSSDTATNQTDTEVVNIPEEPVTDPGMEIQNADTPEPMVVNNPEGPSERILVCYFHGTARCYSCIQIENLTRQAVMEGFADEVASGIVEWHEVNTDEPEYYHYTDDYLLYTKSVVVSEFRDGEEIRWKNLDRIWHLYNDEEEYITYVTGEIEAWLEELEGA